MSSNIQYPIVRAGIALLAEKAFVVSRSDAPALHMLPDLLHNKQQAD